MRKHILWLTLIAFSCGQSNKQPISPVADSKSQNSKSSADTLSERFLIQTILSIDEVKRKDRYLDSLTNHKHHVSVMIEKPSADEKCYHLKVGYNGELRFETYYNFYVDPLSKEISIDDIYSGDRISLNTWRQEQAKGLTE